MNTVATPVTLEQPTKILLVEDDPGDVLLFKTILSQASPHFQLAVVERLRAAFAHLEKEPVDLIVTDLSLPDSLGDTTFAALQERAPEVPIIVISGDTSMETINSLSHVGATHFFSKPVSAALLIRRLRELLAPATNKSTLS